MYLFLLRYSKVTKQKKNTLTFATIWFSVASLSIKPKIEYEINVITSLRETVFRKGIYRYNCYRLSYPHGDSVPGSINF